MNFTGNAEICSLHFRHIDYTRESSKNVLSIAQSFIEEAASPD
jgi:hypothetical protein